MPSKQPPRASKPGVKMKNPPQEVQKRISSPIETALPSDSENGDEFEMPMHVKRIRFKEPEERPNHPLQVGVYLEAIDGRRLSDVTIARTLHKNLLKVQNIFSKGKSQILVKFATTADAKRLINHPTVLDDIKCSATLSVPQTSNKGLVRGVPLEIGDQELLEELNRHPDTQVLSTTRIMRSEMEGEERHKVPTQSVILDFPGNTMPSKVFFFQAVRTVQVYIIKPKLCYKCHTFRHIAKQCKSSMTYCGYCTLNHDTRQCPRDKDKPLCVNCDGEHSPRSMQCPVMQHKFKERMKAALKEQIFQPKPILTSNADFPDGLLKAQSSHEAERQEPQPLPKAAQRNRLRQFSEVLASRTLTPADKLEKRKQKYKKAEQQKPRHVTEQEKHKTQLPKHQPKPDRNTQEREEDWYSPQKDPSQQVDESKVAEKHLDKLIHHMVSNKKALQLLITILSVIINVTLANQSGKIQDTLSEVQKLILQALDPQQESLDVQDPDYADAQEEAEHSENSMEHEDG